MTPEPSKEDLERARGVALELNMCCSNPIAFAPECQCLDCVLRENTAQVVAQALAELRAEGKYLKKSLDKWGSKWYPLFMEPFDLITSARARRKIRLWKTLAKQKKKETQERESLAKKLEKKLNTSQTPRSPRSKTVKKNTIGLTKNS